MGLRVEIDRNDPSWREMPEREGELTRFEQVWVKMAELEDRIVEIEGRIAALIERLRGPP
jgi:hypothetical protein